MIDRCVRFAAAQDFLAEARASVQGACHYARLHRGPAKVLYSDGEGALNNGTPRHIHEQKRAEFKIRARGERATTIGSRSGILR
eukprot:1466788-Pyramimonas_sp.AAC.1